MRCIVLAGALTLSIASLAAQGIPSGWKTVKDKQGLCQMAVPGDWTLDKLLTSSARSPDGKSYAVVQAKRAGQSFAEASSLAKQVMNPSKIVEDSGKRLWYAYQGPNGANGGTNWYVSVSGNPVCAAQVTFRDAAMEETAKKVALSLAQK